MTPLYPLTEQGGLKLRLLHYTKPALALALFSVGILLLYRALRQYELEEVLDSLTMFASLDLAAVAGFAAASYLCLTAFDWLATRYVNRPLPYHKVALASFVSLSIGHNIGIGALSSGAIRYRFYSRWGLSLGDVAKMVVFCALTVALGLSTLGATALLLRPESATEITGWGRQSILALAMACAAIPVTYLGAAVLIRRSLQFRQLDVRMPSLPLALAQIAVGTTNFAIVAACLYQSLRPLANVGYAETASVYLIANVATILSHIPGGTGVVESVVVYLLPHAHLIGGVLVFRFFYFLVPLGIGTTLFILSEASMGGRHLMRTAGRASE